MVAKAGAGPKPIPHASLTPENLSAAIQFCLTPGARAAAHEISSKMQTESGVAAAVDSFHRNLPLDRMRCSVMPDQTAVWSYGKGRRSLTLSKTAANILIEHSKIDAGSIRWCVWTYRMSNDTDHADSHCSLSSYNVNPIIIENRRWDPLTGVLSAAGSTGSNMARSTRDIFYSPYEELKRSRHPANRNDGSRRTSQDTTTQSISSAESSRSRDNIETAGNMAGASLQGVGKFYGTYFRGAVVDIPHAAAEGFRRAPQLYGEKPKDYGTVSDWKSGAKVGGKNFVGGMTSGVTGLLTQPLKGARDEGASGAVKGFARGTMGLATKMPSGEDECNTTQHTEDFRLTLVFSWNRTNGVSIPWDIEKRGSRLQDQNPQGYCDCTA